MNSKFLGVAALILSAGLAGVASVQAQTLADLRADYDTPTSAHSQGETSLGKITDTAGTGAWNFYSSNTVDPTAGGANLTAMIFDTSANFVRAGNAYVRPLATLDLPGWSNGNLITPSETEGTPAANELALHPGNSAPEFAVAAWTSGYTGLIDVSGAIRDMGVFGNGVTLDIWLNDSFVFSSGATVENTPITFDEGLAVGAGDTLYFMVGSNADFSSDQAALAIVITAIPEPAAAVVLAGFTVMGFAVFHRRRTAEAR